MNARDTDFHKEITNKIVSERSIEIENVKQCQRQTRCSLQRSRGVPHSMLTNLPKAENRRIQRTFRSDSEFLRLSFVLR